MCNTVRGSDGGGSLEYILSSFSTGVHTPIRRCVHGGHKVKRYNYCTLRLMLSHLHTIVTAVWGILPKILMTSDKL